MALAKMPSTSNPCLKRTMAVGPKKFIGSKPNQQIHRHTNKGIVVTEFDTLLRANSAKQSQLTAIGSSTNKSSKYMGLSEQQSRTSHMRKQQECDQSEMGIETVKEDATAGKQGGVLSEQVETNSYTSAGFKSGLTGGTLSCFKDRQSDPQLSHYRQSSSHSRFNSKLISRPHYDSRKRDNSATQINAREKSGSLSTKKQILFNQLIKSSQSNLHLPEDHSTEQLDMATKQQKVEHGNAEKAAALPPSGKDYK